MLKASGFFFSDEFLFLFFSKCGIVILNTPSEFNTSFSDHAVITITKTVGSPKPIIAPRAVAYVRTKEPLL